MRDQRLLDYYERELTYLRHLGAEFAESYRDVASRLRLEPTRAEDPHVERLLQGVAFLTARVHLRIDDDFPELSQALLNVVYPHYLRPTPAMSVAEFKPDPDQGLLTTGRHVAKGTRLVSAPTTAGERLRFRTCYDTTLWPIEVSDARWHSPHEVKSPISTDAVAVLRIDLEAGTQASFDELELSDLRFYLNGESGLIGALYELVSNNCSQIVVWNPDLGADGPVLRLSGDSVRSVGFDPDEGMLPASKRSFFPYLLLQEYFTFPQKFHFVDVTGLERIRSAGFGTSMQMLFFVSAFERADRHTRLQEGIDGRSMRLGCTPVVNLFRTEARPITLDHRKTEYAVSVPGDAEVFSVESVFAVQPGSTERVYFSPFYALRHGSEDSTNGAFWFARREPREWSDDSPSDVFLSFVDLDGTSVLPDFHDVSVSTLCTNGNLPNEAMGAGTLLHMEDEGMPVQVLIAPTKSFQAPVDRVDRRTRSRHHGVEGEEFTAPRRPPGGGRQHWRLVSLLSLNHLSLVEDGVDAFREILRLHDPGGSTTGARHIQGLVRINSEPLQAAVRGLHGLSFARGRSVEVEFDEELFAGAGVYLFASVIERFLGMYASINSFSRLTARTRQRSEPLSVWPPRAGLKPLL